MTARKPAEKALLRLSAAATRLGLREPRFARGACGTVMITALPYGRGERMKTDPENPAGSVAPFAQKNFYREMTVRLRTLMKEEAAGDFPSYRIFCNSRLPEKEIAAAAGLGRMGRNSLVFLPGEGSLFVLGGILFPVSGGDEETLRAEVRRDALPAPGEICGACDACVSACPTGAIVGPGLVDRKRCIQGLAAEPAEVPRDIREKWGTVLYGCQACQDVCPLNRNAPAGADTVFGVIGPGAPLAAVLGAAEGALKKTVFRGTALDMGWISEAALKRNAIFAAAHQRARGLLPVIEAFAAGPDPLLLDAARWALDRLRADES
jgi:epoxyqueuosine reductase